jgi:energy-coupling factor transporter ATP-binding protein EcfA2
MVSILKYFRVEEIPDSSVLFILGRRGSGKSTLAAHILATKRKRFTNGICVSATETVNPFWQQYIPSKYVFDKWDPRMVSKLLETQKKARVEGREPEPVFAIFDDLMFDRSFSHSPALKELVLNGRHSNVFVIVLAQYIFDIPPSIRGNVDFVFALQDNIVSNRQKIYEHFGGIFDDFHAFDQVMKTCTVSTDAMVLNQTKRSYDWTQVVSYFGAKPGIRFRVGQPEDWVGDDKWFDDDDKKDIQVKKIYIKPPQFNDSATH